MKKYFACLAVLFALSDVVSVKAQVLNPAAKTGEAASSTKKTKETAASEKKTPSATSQREEYVKTNFDNEDLSEKKYDNTNRKVYSFKIVNDKVVYDENEKRSILVSYDSFQVHKSFDTMVRCSIRVYVLNDFTDRITDFSFKLHWPDISTSVQMNRLNPGVRTYKDIMLLGDGCFSLDKTPTIEVNRCRAKGMTENQCADAVKWYKIRRSE